MEPALVDTDIVSYLFKGDTRAGRYVPALNGRVLMISFMTLAELRRWGRSREWGTVRVARLEAFIAPFVVLYPDDATCAAWAEEVDSARRAGRPIQPADAWIAATAVLHGVPLVTNNPDDYAGVANLRLVTA